MKATAKDLRFHSKELLDSVSRGEEVLITYRGKPCAKLVPIDGDTKKMKDKNELFGIWKNYKETEDVEGYMRNIRKGRF